MTHNLPDWIERLLGIPAAAGEGTVWGIESAWPWPPWATLLFAAAAVVFVVVLYLRQGRRVSRTYRLTPAAIRLGLIALAMSMIAQVTLTLKRTELPGAVVLIDDSLSMTVVDRMKRAGADDAESSRWNLLRTLLTERDGELLRKVAENHNLRVNFLTDDRPSRQRDVPGIVEEIRSSAPAGENTRLGEAIIAALDDPRGTSPAAIIALTDGINTDGPSPAEAAGKARRRGVPLWFVGIGGDRPLRDLKLTDLMVDDVVFLDDAVNFECKLTAVGFEDRKASIVLREKDKPEVLAEVQATAGPDDRPVQVRLPYRPDRVGRFEYVVEAVPQEGESQAENNRQSRAVEVRKEKIRVLLAWAYPSFEFRYLRNMLERDETISLHTVLQDADPEYAEQDAAALRGFPSRREELFAFDVVILGDADPALLGPGALQNLADFVDQPAKGGALALIAGPKFMPAVYRDSPLERLMPFDARNVRSPNPDKVITEGFVARPTDLGLADPGMQLGNTLEETKRIWAGLPPLYWLLELPGTKPGARVLLEHPTRLGPDGRPLPVVLLQYVGAGKVLFHATDETWRWRYRAGNLYFARYWVQTIRWLCRSKLAEAGGPVTLSTDRREYEQGEPVRLRVRFADERLAPAEDDGVTVVVESPGGKTRRVVLHRTAAERGVFQGKLDRPVAGDYRAWIAAPELKDRPPAVDFLVALPANEFARTRMDAAEMRRAAEISGGRYISFETADQLARELPPGRRTPIESLPPAPLWNRWPVLALFLGLLIAEWVLRKRGGMV
ncbi:MAG: hypothetical protein L6306_13590 [Planctomycetales bacterium]|nr:hypothetical protein [Planctomycetales bacterium]